MKRHRMTRKKKFLCGVLALLLVGTAGMVWWQRENLKALKDANQYSSEELEQKLQENQQAIQDALNAVPEVAIRDVTEEERAALKDGTLAQEELIGRLANTGDAAQTVPNPSSEKSASDTKTPTASQTGSSDSEKKPAVDPEYQQKLSEIIAEIYVLREQYTIELDKMYDAAKVEYKAMPVSERTTEKLTKWAGGYISRAGKLEKNCDAAMDDIVERMEKLIRANNGDLSLVDTVVYTYANEKSLKKAVYISKLEERGLI